MILGYALIFATAWVYAVVCILNRALKAVHHAVVLFWHGACGVTLASLAVLIEGWASADGNGIRLFHYDGRVYLMLLGASLFDCLMINSVTIAFQSDSSGFVSLISYLSILYAFAADSFIFQEAFSWLEVGSAIAILLVTVGVSAYKLREGNAAAKRLQSSASFTSAEDASRSFVRYD